MHQDEINCAHNSKRFRVTKECQKKNRLNHKHADLLLKVFEKSHLKGLRDYNSLIFSGQTCTRIRFQRVKKKKLCPMQARREGWFQIIDCFI